MSAVRGTFADFKTVKTRGQCQAIIEFPIEDADHVLAVLGGIPQPSKENWVGVAPVAAPTENTEAPTVDSSPAAPQLKGGERAKSTGILRNKESFTVWLATEYPGYWNEAMRTNTGGTPHIAAATLHLICGVGSCAELDHNEAAGLIWDQIERDYRATQEGWTDEAYREMQR